MHIIKISFLNYFILFSSVLICSQDNYNQLIRSQASGVIALDSYRIYDNSPLPIFHNTSRDIRVVGEQVSLFFTPTENWLHRMQNRICGESFKNGTEYSVEDDLIGLVNDLLSYFEEE